MDTNQELQAIALLTVSNNLMHKLYDYKAALAAVIQAAYPQLTKEEAIDWADEGIFGEMPVSDPVQILYSLKAKIEFHLERRAAQTTS